MSYHLAHALAALIRFPLLLLWRLAGWRVETEAPEIDRYVVTAVPHTSNWDYWHMLVAALQIRRRPFVTAKHTLFRGPMGWFMRAMGGIPIDRTKSNNVVEQVAATIRSSKRMLMVFTPEGTRRYTPHWKTGFYYTALKAGVPIVPAYIDYERRRIGLGPALYPTGDIAADFEQLRAFYQNHGAARYPEKTTALALPPDVAGMAAD